MKQSGAGERIAVRALAAVFVAAGLAKLAGHEGVVRAFEEFGYAPWFRVLVGAVECAGGSALLARGWRAPAAGALALVMLGAIATLLRSGALAAALIPAAFLAALGAVALRALRTARVAPGVAP